MKAAVLDVAERAAWTFAQGFLGVFTLTDTGSARAAVVAGAMAVLSLLKSVAATRANGTISPASLVKP